MLINLYEKIINEDGTSRPGRLAGEIRCKGDGTPGEFIYFHTCNEIRLNKDINSVTYGEKIKIMDDRSKKLFEGIFKGSLFLFTGGGLDSRGVHSIEGESFDTWCREGIEYILKYKLPGTICGKIVEL